jgi:hypothetical protein
MMFALATQLALWIVAFGLLWRLAKRSRLPKAWLVPVIWLVAVLLAGSPMFIATALSFDH